MRAEATHPVSERMWRMFGDYLGLNLPYTPKRLNIGTARNHEDGFVSLDVSPNVGADVVWNLEETPLPFQHDAFDVILASHVMEHVHELVPLMRDLHRITKSGGYLIAITPYGSSDDAWENPFHLRSFSERTWGYFDPRTYVAGTASNGDFGIDFSWHQVEARMIPYPEYAHPSHDELAHLVRTQRNVVRELQVILRKDDGR